MHTGKILSMTFILNQLQIFLNQSKANRQSGQRGNWKNEQCHFLAPSVSNSVEENWPGKLASV